MDEIFNSTPETNTPQETKKIEETPTQPQQATTQDTPVVNTQVNTNPYHASSGAPSTPYNASAYTAPQNAPVNPPYNASYANPYQAATTPQYTTNTTPPPFTSAHGVQVTKAQKQKKNTGKIIFIALVCASIVLSSIAIGLSSSDKNTSSDDSKNPASVTGDGAQANVEDSPISYSEYSGKGAMSAEQVYKAVKDVNVGVLVYSQNQMVGEGSGIIVGEDKSGKYTYILTAAHVISDSNIDVQIQFSDETEAEAIIVGIDSKTDIGVVRVAKTGLKAATFGNSDKLAVGQKVYAIGNPGGTEFFGSFTSGMISAIDRPVPSANSSYDLPCIQHNAAINPGNSGGALVNEYGQVIGLNSSKISSTEYEGMGFAVPSETVLEIYNELILHGYVTNRPMLGISYFAVSSDYKYATIAWKNNLPYGSIAIAYINENSDAGNHGIKVGDIITAVNGKDMDTTDVLLEAIENSKVGDTLTLTVYRLNSNGSVSTTFDAKVKLVEDNGTNTIPQETTQPQYVDPFSYFEGFGY